ncbi:MAG: S41 family peptidase [Acidobacteria bacterium]|nr:S41 family peptidase [Acidobacteriota bacterium]
MKNRFSLALCALLLISLSIPSFVFAQSPAPPAPSRPATGATSRRPALPRGRGLSEAAIAVEQDFAEALSVIQENYVDGNKLDYNNVFKSSIIGMLRTLDPHSNYYDREEYDEFKTEQRSEYYGIGASIGNQRIKDHVDTFILATFEDAPATRAGLRFGDRIIKVDGVEMAEKTSLEVRDKIRGPRGSVVKLTVERAATGKIEVVEITRDSVPQPSVPDAYMLRPGVGYIDMTRGFNYTTADELEYALEFLHDRGMTSLVLDIRNNPGGLLDQAIRVASKFLPSGQLILTQRGRNGLGDRPYHSDNQTPEQLPFVLLINGNSASASEIVAGALQDHDRALLVGENSFGKGLVQSINNLEYGTGLTLTTAKYYTPSGRLIQRDYSNGSIYDYMRGAGEKQKQTGPESHTDLGRPVYSGAGIAPDEAVKPRTISPAQLRLLSPLFYFTRELVNGRVSGFEAYKVQRAIDFNHKLQASDFPVTDALYQAFKSFVAKDAAWNAMAAQLDRNRSFIELQLRYDMITAAYGRVTADEVLIQDDPQVAKALEALPRARQLALSAMRKDK